MRIKFLLIFLIVLLSKLSVAQIVWESPKHEVVSFLSRQAQKGNITLSDYIQPISRKEISKLLAQLRYANLSIKENKELSFYQKEFSEFDTTSNNPSLSILKKDNYARFRMLSVQQDGFLLRVDPILTLETTQSSSQNLFKESHGLSFFGQMGSHFSVQASFRDITESGTGIDSLKNFTPEIGVVRTQNINDGL